MRTASLLGSVLVTALATSSAHACDIGRWQPHIAEASRRYGIAEDWIRAVMRAESAGCMHLDGRPITSSAGAMGLMQLMPATWAELRERHGFGTDPHEPRDNILAGTAYLRELADRFGVPGAFAAYHAGPGRYESHLRHGAALPVETRRYLAQVSAAAGVGTSEHTAERNSVMRPDSLFAVVRNRRAPDTRDSHSPDPRLFVPLQHARSADAEASSASLEQTHAEP